MARDESPFLGPPGRTYYNGETIDINDLGGVNLEGKEYRIEDPSGSGEYQTLKIVRNVSGVTLYGKRLVRYKTGYYGRRVDGYTTTTGEAGYPIHDAYATNGVVNNDLMYIVVLGPVIVKNGTGVATTTVITEKDPLTALTAAASTGASTTDAGRVRTADFTGATAPLATAILGIPGRATNTAATSGVTNADITMSVTKFM